jgi:UDP-N-acetylmuramate--alanine ligase
MNIYFAGIGGVGIGPLAQIARDAGYRVQGSDTTESLTTQQLRDQGVAISFVQDGSFLQSCHDEHPIDWLTYTSSLPPDHPELALAKKLGIKTAKRDELLAHILKEKNLKLIAVAGTHGKTTTSGMLVWTLKQLGIPVSYSVGSTLSFGPSGVYTPDSQYFVYECDEFDRNFLHFSPYLSLITNIDYDHPDSYPTEQSYLAAFRQFVDQSSLSIMWHVDGKRVNATADDGWILRETEVAHINLAGQHNRKNATLVLKAAEYLGIGNPDQIRTILDTFPGTDRRFERLADNLFSDYGHHPTEIAATLQLAREISSHVVLVYQPHQNVRQHEIVNDYVHCFELADEVYWLPTYLSREDPTLPILTPYELSKNVTNKSSIHFADLDDALWSEIQSAQKKGALVLAMGAGNIDHWLRSKLGN